MTRWVLKQDIGGGGGGEDVCNVLGSTASVVCEMSDHVETIATATSGGGHTAFINTRTAMYVYVFVMRCVLTSSICHVLQWFP